MSQRDTVAEIRTARVTAPEELRERVRLIAISAETPPPRRFVTWRRAAVVAIPVAAAIAAVVVFSRPGSNSPNAVHGEATVLRAQTSPKQPGGTFAPRALSVPASPTRVQRYGASLTLRVGSVED